MSLFETGLFAATELLPEDAFMKLVSLAAVVVLPGMLFAPKIGNSSTGKLSFEAKCPQPGLCKPIAPTVLPNGNILLTVGDSVCMVDSKGKQLWIYATGESILAAPAFNPRLNEVAVIGFDLYFARLDAVTGKLKWKADSVGRALFRQIESFSDGYLLVVDMQGYREKEKDFKVPAAQDRLEFWGPTRRASWSVSFPQGAKLLVIEKRIYAVFSSIDRMTLHEIVLPGPLH